MTAPAQTSWTQRATLVALVAYWLALFCSTHLPHPPSVIFAYHWTDKLLHCSAYAGLAFLFALYRSVRQPITWQTRFRIFAVLALFGIFDEITQIPVGRTCDIFDWLCDMMGIALGLAAFHVVEQLWKRRLATRV